ncbi:hypothetical protein KGM_201171 [Danaus plexippus plexippus]|uniref:Uncharacterized protein n=1 Tax=Danaus plexippus plexippus TaxID=278856 RepID=A0A212EZ51_DANPL|nr:hypothetical protein KGM_201171 [Danaus plexippus plexippus]
MENQSLNYMRESTRNFLNFHRRKHKNECNDIHRPLEDIGITSEIIAQISNKLHTKSSISAKELQILKNGFMNPKNVEIFLHVHGALRGLIRELTCSNIKKQCISAGCVCNLSLGDSGSCSIIAKAGGPYLNASLDNLTVELAVNCAWALGNLAGSDVKVCKILVTQGALNKLCKVYTNEDIQNAALYALLHFVYQLRDELRPEHLQEILQTITELDITMSSSRILFILSCHENFPEHISEQLLQKILINMTSLIESQQNCKQESDCELVYLIRTLANSGRFDYILNYLSVNGVSLKQLLDASNPISESVLWLLGNMYNYCSDREIFCKVIN